MPGFDNAGYFEPGASSGETMSDNVSQNHVFYRNPAKFYPKAVKGEGIYIHDQEGNTYIDGSGGAVVVSIGHGVREVREAMLEQAGQIAFTHGSPPRRP
jgi:adenosylmethionine-8-amino-7-oxononanoate aminotransferase